MESVLGEGVDESKDRVLHACSPSKLSATPSDELDAFRARCRLLRHQKNQIDARMTHIDTRGGVVDSSGGLEIGLGCGPRACYSEVTNSIGAVCASKNWT